MVRINKTAVATGICGLVLGVFIGTQVPLGVQTERGIARARARVDELYYRPYFTGNSLYVVKFADDNGLSGMRAFAHYHYGREEPEYHAGKSSVRVELKLDGRTESYNRFRISEEFMKFPDFMVVAIDRDGNRSDPAKVRTLDGVVLEQQHEHNPQYIINF